MRERLRLVANDRQRFEIRRRAFVVEQILGEMQDRGERVVQLVRDAGDELAERRELLGLAERLFGGAQRRDVLDEAFGEPERAALVAIGARAHAHGDRRCRPCDATPISALRSLALRLELVEHAVAIGRRREHVARHVDLKQLRRRFVAEQLRRARR